jgi:WD40 repeat protein
MAPPLKYRYPGVNNFTTDDEDIFCGRKEDAEKLYRKIMLNKTLVLHADSGTGKSSLIQAGIIPLLTKNKVNYIPITVRFQGHIDVRDEDARKRQNADNVLVRRTLMYINQHKEDAAASLPYIDAMEEDLWYDAKLFERNNKSLFLIFDQFEELQSYSPRQVEYFKDKLSDLLRSAIPDKIYSEIEKNSAASSPAPDKTEYNNNIRFLEQPLQVKALFVVREDKLGTMSLLADYFPDIFKNDFQLLPLDYANASKAITEPASKEGQFASPPFSFEADALNKLMKSLADDNGMYDPLQLQVICSSIERKIETHGQTVKESDLQDVGDILSDFYKSTWISIKNEFYGTDPGFDKLRKEIVSKLIVGETRNLAHETSLSEADKDGWVIPKLVEYGLIRKIPGQDVNYYQLCHDRLVMPVIDDLKVIQANEKLEQENEEARKKLEKEIEEARIENERREKLNMRYLYFSILLAVLFIVSIWLAVKSYNLKNAAQAERILATAQFIRKTNPTLAYRLVRDFQNEDKKNQGLQSFLDKYESADYTYMIGSFPLYSKLIHADINKDNQLMVAEESIISNWDIHKEVIESEQKLRDGVLVKVIPEGDQNIYVLAFGDTLVFRNQQGAILSTIPGASATNANYIALSPDHKLVVIYYKVLNFKTGAEVADLAGYYPYIGIEFLKDSKHLAIGLSNGYKAIASINPSAGNQAVKLVYVYPYRTGLLSLKLDHRNNKLLAVNANHEIEVWKLDDTWDEGNTVDTLLTRSIQLNPLYLLKAHTDQINSLAISEDDSFALSGSNDHTAILWNLFTGKKVSTIRGREFDITYVNFSRDGKSFITSTEQDHNLKVWRMESPSALYSKDMLARYAPFEYYVIGLYNYNVGKVYDTTTTSSLFSATLHYLTNMPVMNRYPEDKDHLESIRQAIQDVKSMYSSLMTKPDLHIISAANRRILNKYYKQLAFNEDDLLLKSLSYDTRKKNAHVVEHHLENYDDLLSDTADINTVIGYLTDLSPIITFDFDSTKNYKEIIRYLEKTRMMLDVFALRFSSNDEIIRYRVSTYNDLVKAYLLDHSDTSLSLAFARGSAGAKFSCYEKYGISNKILALLLQNKYDDAKKIYRENVKKIYKCDYTLQLQDMTNEQMLDLKKRGVTSDAMDKFYAYLNPTKSLKSIPSQNRGRRDGNQGDYYQGYEPAVTDSSANGSR